MIKIKEISSIYGGASFKGTLGADEFCQITKDLFIWHHGNGQFDILSEISFNTEVTGSEVLLDAQGAPITYIYSLTFDGKDIIADYTKLDLLRFALSNVGKN